MLWGTRRSALVALALSACAPGLSDPSRFDGGEVCDFDVQEDLLIPRCTSPGCHAPYESAAGLEFVTGGLGERLARTEASTCAGHMLIDPADPSASFLLTRVSPDPTCDGVEIERMPLIGEPLTEHELACLTRWVESVAASVDAGVSARDAGAHSIDASAVDASAMDASAEARR